MRSCTLMAVCCPSLSSLATRGYCLDSLQVSTPLSLNARNELKGLGRVLPRRIELPLNATYLSRCSRLRLQVLSNSDEAMDETASNSGQDAVGKLQTTISASFPAVFSLRRHLRPNIIFIVAGVAAVLIITVRLYIARKTKMKQRSGTVADLVRRGQLRSDSRGISKPLKYDDPFNNPFVKTSKSNSTVEICGKSYRLAPVTLTKEDQTIHRRRRSRAYQWKRPTVFLREGDPIPSDIDPETVRWIPANHPFATTVSDIDEGLAQKNVHQKTGVPFRIRAEHEALQKKLEALQSEQQPDRLPQEPTRSE